MVGPQLHVTLLKEANVQISYLLQWSLIFDPGGHPTAGILGQGAPVEVVSPRADVPQVFHPAQVECSAFEIL